MKRYLGCTEFYTGRRSIYVQDEEGGPARALKPITRQEPVQWEHPLAWGYAVAPGRSGNATRNAAYTILQDAAGEAAAEQHCRRFAEQVLGRVRSQRAFELREDHILEWIEKQLQAA